jgi:signal transduction histidine kinase
MKFATRIILTAGLSTLLLTSLYWLVGWQLVEGIEESNREAIVEYLRSQPELAHLDPTPLLEEPSSSETMEIALVIVGVLLFSAGTMGLTLLLLWQQTRPVRALMQAIQAVDPAAPRLEPLNRQDELGEMSRCFAQLLARIQGFIEREQNFTRFASHELRSPLMAMRSSLALLQEMSSDAADSPQRRALVRINRALQRMEQLTDSFLWLSREQVPEQCQVDAPQLRQLLDQHLELAAQDAERLQVQIEPPLHWSVHPSVLSVILDNLLGNAHQHGGGCITLHADAHRLTVTNPVASAPAADHSQHRGFGYGLPIITQLCEKAGARFRYEHTAEHFIARVEFQPPRLAAD